ncbi:hypothetical protein D3C73_1039860 [compost metagenome]
MHMDPAEVLRSAFTNVLDRKVKAELMQDFIDRSRNYNSGNQDVIAVLDEPEKQIPKG